MKLKHLFLLLFLFSCYIKPRYELVNSDGQIVKINKMMPKFNEEQIKKQELNYKNNINTTQINDNLQVNKFSINENEKNFLNYNEDRNKLYPDDIFVDRITNYKYIDYEENYNKNTKNVKKKEDDIIILEEPIEDKKNIEIKEDKKTILEKGFYIQIGVYTEKTNADFMFNKFKNIHTGIIETYYSRNKKKYKVYLGPYKTRNIAEKDLEKVINTGHYDVYITEKK